MCVLIKSPMYQFSGEVSYICVQLCQLHLRCPPTDPPEITSDTALFNNEASLVCQYYI